ncbi:DUF5416 family protein [Campylobacter sp. 9BO]|uniref:DUF5416 family protein n=1 Tax=Campylobacter sp. 9BO TaxID=3424759 RepID=UPI003D3288CC
MGLCVRYDKNFSDYKITKAGDSGLMLISDDEISDIVDTSVSELYFKDVTKKFDDLLVNEQIYDIIIKFGIEIQYAKEIETLKILIQGYDENSDNLVFDTTFLSSPYRYSITDDSIEVSINLGKDSAAHDFLQSLALKCRANEIYKEKKIFVYINGNLIYDKIYTSQDRNLR